VCFGWGWCVLFVGGVVGGSQANTSPEKNYAVEIPPKEYSPGITALQGLAQCREPAPPGVTSHLDHWQAPAR
ncbi:unnamed protein product, partial [Ectocarpus sp. 8 AP-2014]